ncbi:VanW family protein [Patescibacteria group bacterium]|nr:VanW family protein [Patescibacteria group bacterium]
MKKELSKRIKNKKTIILIFAIIPVIFILGIIYLINEKYSDKIFPNIFINEERYTNLTKNQALDKIDGKVKNMRENGITLSYKEEIYNISLAELGVVIDTARVVEQAYSYGHKENIIDNLQDYFLLQGKNINFWITAEIDNKTMENYILNNFSDIEKYPVNFHYTYEEDNFISNEGKSGIVIDKSKIKKDIANNVTKFQNEIIAISLMEKMPEITSDYNKTALLHSNNLIENKIFLKYNESQWEVQKADLAPWIDYAKSESNNLGIVANHSVIKDYLLTIVPQINREPVNAQLDFKDGKIEIFSLSQEGVTLQIEKSIEEINQVLFQPENYSEALEKEIEIQMITEKVEPEITTKSIDNMGITSLLATGESNFAGSPKNRRHNIAVGAGKFQGILIGPGDEFSFVKVLGGVGPREGYLPELVIKQGETIPEYGGGLCQVSTTAFRGAVLAGLEITERKNHAYAVSYYSPQGTDATIYPPHPDLAFKNNTPAYILLQTRIEGNKLYFDFYGSDDGRKVKTKGPVIYDRQKDGSMKSVWTQQVYDENEELLFENKFYSNYKSPNLYPHKNPLE